MAVSTLPLPLPGREGRILTLQYRVKLLCGTGANRLAGQAQTVLRDVEGGHPAW
jgi:hypothetical protein